MCTGYTWQHGIPEPVSLQHGQQCDPESHQSKRVADSQDDFLSDRRLAIIFRRVKGVPDIAMASTPDVDDSERVETSKGPHDLHRAMVLRRAFSWLFHFELLPGISSVQGSRKLALIGAGNVSLRNRCTIVSYKYRISRGCNRGAGARRRLTPMCVLSLGR